MATDPTSNSALLPGESYILNEEEATFLSPVGPDPGIIAVTNFRVQFSGKKQGFHIPLCTIERIEKIGGQTSRGEHAYGIEIHCKDLRSIRIAHRQEGHSRRQVFESLTNQAFPYSAGKKPFAYAHYEAQNGTAMGGWRVFDSEEEFKRMGAPDTLWRLSSVNGSYDVCSTYPAKIGVPAGVSDEDVRTVAHFRSRGRLPALSWFNNSNTATITRCSQPKVGMTGKRSREDENMIKQIREANTTNSEQLLIFDARPKRNAVANQAKGLGFESTSNYDKTSLIFLNIHNIHVMRDSLKKLRDMCYPTIDDHHWYTQLENTGWLKHSQTILTGAVRIANEVAEGTSCLIHCSDGWDRTAQLSCLAMLMLDPYYRTIKGFEVLIEKEWLSFGHKFHQRIGHGDSKHGDDQRSPVFLQFIDCVWQITQQFSCAFEFNEMFLIEILDHLYSCQFGTFLKNCERERHNENLVEKTLSLWDHINNKKSDFENPLYQPESHGHLHVIPSMRYLRLWNGYFLRWHRDIVPEESVLKRTQELRDLNAQLQEQILDLKKLQDSPSN